MSSEPTTFVHSSVSPRSRLPELAVELQNLLKDTESQIRELPAAPSDDAQGEIIVLVSDFARELASYVEGTPDDNGIHQAIRVPNKIFLAEICDTAPRFCPFTSGDSQGYTHPEYLPLDGRPETQADDNESECSENLAPSLFHVGAVPTKASDHPLEICHDEVPEGNGPRIYASDKDAICVDKVMEMGDK